MSSQVAANRSRHLFRTVLLLCCSLVPLSSFAQESVVLWENGGPLGVEFDRLLPDVVSYQRAVVIDPSAIGELQSGRLISLELAPAELLTFRLLSSRQFLNGDIGVSGTASLGGNLSMLSLVVSDDAILGTINTGSRRFTISAQLDSDSSYSGYLYTQGENAQFIPIDGGGLPTSALPGEERYQNALPLTGNDVSVVQTLSSEIATVGEQVDISIKVTNNTATTLSNEALNVLFILDESSLTFSSGSCTTTNLGSQFSLQCTLPDIAPGAETTIDYSVLLTDDSYPQLLSSVFVGDLTGEHVRQDAFIFVIRDTLTDSDGDGLSDFNEELTGTDPDNSASAIDANAIVETDVMFLYTQRFVNDIGAVAPETKINQLVELTNGYYANSGVKIAFRPVLYRLVDFSFRNSVVSAIQAMRSAEGVLSFIPDTRDAVGADIVVMIDGLFLADQACGIGSTPGVGFQGELFHEQIVAPELYVAQYTDGFSQQGASGCDDLTLAHELGHNHGLDHSHREDSAAGTFPWSLGHGVDGSFNTIMAYTTHYPGSESIPLFSNPQSTDCNGLPCGISRNDLEQGADAVHSLNHTRFQVSNRRSSRILPITSLSGSSNLIAYGGASRSGASEIPLDTFNAGDSIDVRATLEIPSEHQGTVGETYVVISVDGSLLFYIDAVGNYQSWDGELESLQASIAPRALNASEELIAFENFVPISAGVEAAALTVYFAYSIPGTDVFAYSSNGISLTIQP